MSVLRIVKSVLSAASIGALVILTVEVCARIEDKMQWGAPFWGYYSYTQLATFDEFGRHNRPHAQFEKWKINAFGFRSAEISLVKPDSVTRIITVGASETFGLYESEGMEYPAQLQTVLDSVAPGRFEVLNAACPGMTPPRIRQYYADWLTRFDPDIIAYIPQPSSYLYDNPVPDRAIALPSDTSAPAFQLRSWNKAREVIKSFVPLSWRGVAWQREVAKRIRENGDDWVWNDIPAERLQTCLAQLEDLAHHVQRSGATLLLGLPPAKYTVTSDLPEDPFLMAAWRSTPRAKPELILAFQQAVIDSLRQASSFSGVTMVDLLTDLHGKPSCFVDLFHYNDIGARLVAEAFADSAARVSAAQDPTSHAANDQ